MRRDAPGDLRARHSPHAQPERDVVEDGLVGEERVVLEHDAHVAVLGVEPRDVASGEHDLSLVGRQQARR